MIPFDRLSNANDWRLSSSTGTEREGVAKVKTTIENNRRLFGAAFLVMMAGCRMRVGE